MAEARVALERDHALIDVQRECRERGFPVRVSLRSEGDVQRDAYGSQKARPTATVLDTYALPWTENPSRRDLDRAGLAGVTEEIAAVAWTPTKDWADAGLAYESIDPARATVTAGGQRYGVESRGRASPFADSFLYVTLALRRA